MADGEDSTSAEKKKKPQLSRTVKDKWRAKQWYRVRAPALFQNAEMGETPALEPETLVGRTLETTLAEISGGGDLGKIHIKLRFRVESVSPEKVAETRFVGHELTTDYIRRLARRKRSKIDTSLPVVTKDGVEIQLKPVAVSEHRLQTRLRTMLRQKLRSLLQEEAASKTGAEFVRDMLNGELGKNLSQGLRLLYPLKKIEIRASEVRGIIPDSTPALAEAPTTPPPEGEVSPGPPGPQPEAAAPLSP